MRRSVKVNNLLKSAKSGKSGPRVKGYKRTVVDGQTFDSKREAKRYQELLLLERSGEIGNLERQVKIELYGRDGPIKTPTGRNMTYVADFRYVDWSKNGITVIEDAKGHKTDTYKMKKAILAAQGISILET